MEGYTHHGAFSQKTPKNFKKPVVNLCPSSAYQPDLYGLLVIPSETMACFQGKTFRHFRFFGASCNERLIPFPYFLVFLLVKS